MVLGSVLLTAALKGCQLATDRVAETGLLTSRWFLIGIVAFGLFVGLWLLVGGYPKWTWRVAVLCFGGFGCMPWYKALSGAAFRGRLFRDSHSFGPYRDVTLDGIRRMLVVSGWILAVAFALTEARLAHAQGGSQIMKEMILEAMRSRAERVRSARIEWQEECFDAKGSLLRPDSSDVPAILNAKGLTIPPEDVTYHNQSSLTFDGLKTRFTSVGQYPQEMGLIDREITETFDGQNRRVFKAPNAKRTHPLGRVYSVEAKNKLLSMLQLEPLLQCYRLNHPEMKLFNFDEHDVEDGNSVVDGRRCVLFANRGSTSQGRRHLFWLDPAREFIILRFAKQSGDSIVQQTDFSWTPDSEVGWVLAGWKLSKRDTDGALMHSVTATVTSCTINPSIPESEFVLKFPADTYVDDMSDGPSVNYILRADGHKRMVTLAEREASYEELLNSESGGAAPPIGRRKLSPWLLLANILVVALFVLLIMRHKIVWFHRKRSV